MGSLWLLRLLVWLASFDQRHSNDRPLLIITLLLNKSRKDLQKIGDALRVFSNLIDCIDQSMTINSFASNRYRLPRFSIISAVKNFGALASIRAILIDWAGGLLPNELGASIASCQIFERQRLTWIVTWNQHLLRMKNPAPWRNYLACSQSMEPMPPFWPEVKVLWRQWTCACRRLKYLSISTGWRS